METIKIDPDGKYALVIKGLSAMSHADCAVVQKELNKWWASNDKFIVFGIEDDCEVRFERVGSDIDCDPDNKTT